MASLINAFSSHYQLTLHDSWLIEMATIQVFFWQVSFSPFYTCKQFHYVLNLPKGRQKQILLQIKTDCFKCAQSVCLLTTRRRCKNSTGQILPLFAVFEQTDTVTYEKDVPETESLFVCSYVNMPFKKKYTSYINCFVASN